MDHFLNNILRSLVPAPMTSQNIAENSDNDNNDSGSSHTTPGSTGGLNVVNPVMNHDEDIQPLESISISSSSPMTQDVVMRSHDNNNNNDEAQHGDRDSMPDLQSVSNSSEVLDLDSDEEEEEEEEEEAEVMMHAVDDDDDSEWSDESDDIPALEAIPPRLNHNRRARVEDDEDEERDRRHPSQRVRLPLTATGSVVSPATHASNNPNIVDTRPNPPPQTNAANTPQRQMNPFINGFAIAIDANGQRIVRPLQTGFPFLGGNTFNADGAGAVPANGPGVGAGAGNFMDFLGFLSSLSESEKDDPVRAKKLVDALEEVPVGLLRRLEALSGKIIGEDGGSGNEGDGMGAGDCSCAICWDRLLDGEGGFTVQGDQDNADVEAETSRMVSSSDPSQPKIVTLPCAHVFHAACLVPWFSRPRQTTCPTCRFNIDPERLTARRPQRMPWPWQPMFQTPPPPPQGPQQQAQFADAGGAEMRERLLQFLRNGNAGVPPATNETAAQPEGSAPASGEDAATRAQEGQPQPNPPSHGHAEPQTGGVPPGQSTVLTFGFDIVIGPGGPVFTNLTPPTTIPISDANVAPTPDAGQPHGQVHAQDVDEDDDDQMQIDALANFPIDLSDAQAREFGQLFGLGVGEVAAPAEAQDQDQTPTQPGSQPPAGSIDIVDSGFSFETIPLEGDAHRVANDGVNAQPQHLPTPEELHQLFHTLANPSSDAGTQPAPGIGGIGTGLPPLGFMTGPMVGTGRTMGEALRALFSTLPVLQEQHQHQTEPQPQPTQQEAGSSGSEADNEHSPPLPPDLRNFISGLVSAVVQQARDLSEDVGAEQGSEGATPAPAQTQAQQPPAPNTVDNPSPMNEINNMIPDIAIISLPSSTSPTGPAIATGNASTASGGGQSPMASRPISIPGFLNNMRGFNGNANSFNGGNVLPPFNPLSTLFAGGVPRTAPTGTLPPSPPQQQRQRPPQQHQQSHPNMPRVRERQKWSLPSPPGATLRQLIEKRELEAGLRCSDISCGVGPSDEEPYLRATKGGGQRVGICGSHEEGKEAMYICGHTFHPACLVSAARVALMGAEVGEVEGHPDLVEVACTVCKGVGNVKKGLWEEGVGALV
ncbi:hypothetical protein H0H93_011774 [Arthromyces matolae]|nr:hypothetical protein H0H93_011774 [Arthromyces matolae]